MVTGLDIFKEHFAAFADRYILIGGGACDMQFTQQALTFRATKDLDIILIVEALDDVFVGHFWDFIKAGEYAIAEINDKKCFYRFHRPAVAGYPKMLELFSRNPDILNTVPDIHITDIPTGEEVSSLSAILLNSDYYEFTLTNSEMIDGVHVASNAALICLKVRAFLNNTERKNEGQPVQEVDINKHRNDVIRLTALVTTGQKVNTIPVIDADLRQFLSMLPSENLNLPSIFRNTGIPAILLPDIMQRLTEIFL